MRLCTLGDKELYNIRGDFSELGTKFSAFPPQQGVQDLGEQSQAISQTTD